MKSHSVEGQVASPSFHLSFVWKFRTKLSSLPVRGQGFDVAHTQRDATSTFVSVSPTNEIDKFIHWTQIGVLFNKFVVGGEGEGEGEGEVELCEGGRDKDVDDNNKMEFVHLVTQFHCKFGICTLNTCLSLMRVVSFLGP